MQKRGASAIIVTVLIILISIVAFSTIYVLVKSQVSDVGDSHNNDCYSISLKPYYCEYNSTSLVVKVKRNAGSGRFDSIRFMFNVNQTGLIRNINFSLNELETKEFYWFDGIVPSEVDVAAIIGKNICPPTRTPLTCLPTDLVFVRSNDTNGTGNQTQNNECNDGIDNDRDSWTDGQDSDCENNGTKEGWVALGECNDGIDNDGDGVADKLDNGCENSLDQNERDRSNGPQCSDGIDNDGDGLTDYPVDPGCSSESDTAENGEAKTHSFKFKFNNDGLMVNLNWTDINGKEKSVVWDEYGRYGFNWQRYYPHSQYNANSWSVIDSNGVATNITHAQITYTKELENSDLVKIRSRDSLGFLEINDSYRFYQDSMYLTFSVRNLRNEKIKVYLPTYLGALNLGNKNTTGQLNLTDTNISRLRPERAGFIENDFNTTNAVPNLYPSIESYSPVEVMWDDNLTIGEQYLTLMYLPTQVTFTDKARSAFNPVMMSFVNTELEPLSTKTFTIQYKMTMPGNWRGAIQPYKNWFSYMYGTTPNYCPTGPAVTYVAWNSRMFNQNNTDWENPNFELNRYFPDTKINSVFEIGESSDAMQKLGLDLMGVWGTGPSALYFSREGSYWLEAEWTNNELFDPNLDIGPDHSLLKPFKDQYKEKDVNVFWYIRPCAEVYGGNITYYSNGSYSFVRGEPSLYRNVDLRNVTNRDRSIDRLRLFANNGINNFYFDAMGCPGDEAYTTYARKVIEEEYGIDPILFKEGGRDRDSLQINQMPLIKYNFETGGSIQYTANSSLLIKELVPMGGYYGGIFNTPLNPSERDDIVSKGYQVIEFNCPPTLRSPHDPTFCPKPTTQNCARISKSYDNRHNLWVSYGRDVPGCSEPPASPPACPV